MTQIGDFAASPYVSDVEGGWLMIGPDCAPDQSANDQRCLMVMVSEQAPELYRTALRIARNPDDAQDIVANVALKIGTMAPERLPLNAQSNWLHAVTRNLALNYVKQRARCSPVEWIEQITAGPCDQPENAVQELVDFELLLACLDEIPRLIIVEKISNQRTHKEIAKMLRLPEGTVRRKYSEALRSLRQSVEACQVIE